MAFVSTFPGAAVAPATPRAPPLPSSARPARMAARDSPPPPARLYETAYPAARRFHAPAITLRSTGDDATSTVAVAAPEVPLDAAAAAGVLAAATARAALAREGASALLFRGAATNAAADNPVDRYFPPTRRYEMPVITVDVDGGALTLAVETATTVDAVAAEAAAEADAAAATAADGAFWKRPSGTPGWPADRPAASAAAVVDAAFPPATRGLAPDISFAAGTLGVSVAMTRATGGVPPPDAYARFAAAGLHRAPVIELKAPAGGWDTVGGYVTVGSEEVPLRLDVAARL